MRLAHDLNGAFSNIALGHIFQPPALVLDVLHFQLQQGGQFAGERLIPLLIAVLHGLYRLVVSHFPDDKGHFLQPGQLTTMMAAMARHDLITVAILFRAGKTRNHYAVCLDGRYRFLHFGVVPHLKRMGAECVEWMHFGKLQIDQLSFLHRTGRSGWLRRRLFRGRSRIFGWGLFGFRGSFNLRSLFPTSGQFVSLSRRGLAGGRLIRLGWAALAGLRRLLASRLRFFLFWGTAPTGLFRFAIPSGRRFLLRFLLRLFCRLLFFYLGPGCLPLFIHQLIDFVKGHHHITGLGLGRPLLLGCGSGSLFGSRSLGLVNRNRRGSLRELLLTGACVQFFICHSLSSFS